MSEKNDIDPGDLSVEMITPHVDTVFTLAGAGDEPVTLTLMEVSTINDHRPSGNQQRRSPFVLVFGSPKFPLPQGNYRLLHPVLGAVTIFMTPFAAYEAGHKMEAVFS